MGRIMYKGLEFGNVSSGNGEGQDDVFDRVYDTVDEMNADILAGNVPLGSLILVREEESDEEEEAPIYKIVNSLPTSSISKSVIYLVPKSTPSEQNAYNKYIYAENAWEKIGGEEGSTSIEIDSALSSTSTNPVQNKVIKTALDSKVNNSELARVAKTGNYNDLLNKPTIPEPITVDSALNGSSTNPVQNKVIYQAFQNMPSYEPITVDSALSNTSTNPVQNKVIKSALDGKQNTLTFDNAPAANSNNPVTSRGIYNAIIRDYSNLNNKPAINGVELTGDLSLSDLGMGNLSVTTYTAQTFTRGSDIYQAIQDFSLDECYTILLNSIVPNNSTHYRTGWRYTATSGSAPTMYRINQNSNDRVDDNLVYTPYFKIGEGENGCLRPTQVSYNSQIGRYDISYSWNFTPTSGSGKGDFLEKYYIKLMLLSNETACKMRVHIETDLYRSTTNSSTGYTYMYTYHIIDEYDISYITLLLPTVLV